MSQPPPDKITLEDLLRFKRAERPPAEFWAQFDRELHAKQLAALVEKKPHWNFAVRRLVRVASFPLSAVAVFALAFVMLQPATDEVAANRARAPRIARTVAPLPAAVATPAASMPLTSPPEAMTGEKTAASVRSAVPAAGVVPAVASGAHEPSSAFSQLTAALWSAPPSARPTPAGLALAQMVQLSDSTLEPASLESIGGAKTRPAADPLAQVSAPGETRHERILAALTDTRLVSEIEPASVSRTRERIASRLASEGFAADDISRLGVEGTQVSFKF